MNFQKCVVVTAIFLSGFFMMNCGKKGDPVCPGIARPAVISDLTATMAEGEVELGWTITTNKTDTLSFRIFRSEMETQDADCPGCPRRYALMAELSSHDPRLRWGERTTVTCRDSTVRIGYLYSYTVIVCGPSDVCSDESNMAEIRIP